MGSLYRQKGSQFIWMKYYVNGRAVRESTGTDKPKEAERLLKTREGRAAQGLPIPPRLDRIRYDEIRDDLVAFYQTTGKRKLAEVEDRLAYLDRFFRGYRVATITPALLTQYAQRRQQDRTHLWAPDRTHRRATSNRTINLELGLLKRMLRLAVKQDKALRVPVMEMLKEAPPREGFFEDREFHRIRRALPEDLQVAVTIAQTYGWRIESEVFPLARRHLDLEVGTLRLDPGTTKNSEGRVVYLTPDLNALLAAQIARVDALSRRLGRIVPHLFPHLEGRHAGTQRQGMRARWKTVCEETGVANRIPHDTRRTAVRNLERAGVPRSVAMKITGHKTEAVYRRYAIVSDADLRDAARRLATVENPADAARGHSFGHSRDIAVDSRRGSGQNP
jgi:integrase